MSEQIQTKPVGIPTLENWHVGTYLDGKTVIAYGQVYNDHRWDDGTPIRTSPVQYLRNGQLRTKNTTYKLGEMLNESNSEGWDL